MNLTTNLKQKIVQMTTIFRKYDQTQMTTHPILTSTVESSSPDNGTILEQPTQEAIDMATLQELQAQLAEVQKQIAETTYREKADGIAKVKQLMAEHGLSIADITGGGDGKRRGRPAGGGGTKGQKVPPKYRDPVSGKEWTGRGVAPNWIKDKNRYDFLIKV